MASEAVAVVDPEVVFPGRSVDSRPPKRPLLADELEVDQVDKPTTMASLELLESVGWLSDCAVALDFAVGVTLSLTETPVVPATSENDCDESGR